MKVFSRASDNTAFTGTDVPTVAELNNMNFQEEFSYRLDDIFGNDVGRALWSNVEWSEEAVIPIPAALPLLLSGLAGLGLIGWRRRKTT